MQDAEVKRIRVPPPNAVGNVVIRKSGAYRLFQDLVLSRDSSLSVETHHVDVDLNGFEIRNGDALEPAQRDLVVIGKEETEETDVDNKEEVHHVTIRNGIVGRGASTAIRVGRGASHVALLNLHIVQWQHRGVHVEGARSTRIEDVTVRQNETHLAMSADFACVRSAYLPALRALEHDMRQHPQHADLERTRELIHLWSARVDASERECRTNEGCSGDEAWSVLPDDRQSTWVAAASSVAAIVLDDAENVHLSRVTVQDIVLPSSSFPSSTKEGSSLSAESSEQHASSELRALHAFISQHVGAEKTRRMRDELVPKRLVGMTWTRVSGRVHWDNVDIRGESFRAMPHVRDARALRTFEQIDCDYKRDSCDSSLRQYMEQRGGQPGVQRGQRGGQRGQGGVESAASAKHSLELGELEQAMQHVAVLSSEPGTREMTRRRHHEDGRHSESSGGSSSCSSSDGECRGARRRKRIPFYKVCPHQERHSRNKRRTAFIMVLSALLFFGIVWAVAVYRARRMRAHARLVN